MKKILACFCALLLCTTAWAAPEISGVWGIPFGASFEEANETMKAHGAAPFLDAWAARIGRTAMYQASFFDKSCIVVLRFHECGMWRAELMFRRVETPEGKGNYRHLSELLDKKYGTSKVIKDATSESRQWGNKSQLVELTADNRSVTDNTTVLVYTDRTKVR